MKTLSVRQPWAWLIVHGHKNVENRTWSTSHRGDVLIHASSTIDRDVQANLRAHAAEIGLEFPEQFTTGAIIGIVSIDACVRDHESQWFSGPVGWILSNPRAIDPVPARGHLGLWEFDF